jgi:hypothetical protein
LIRNVTERIPITSFQSIDNETAKILEKLSPDTRAALMRVAIESDAKSNLTHAIINATHDTKKIGTQIRVSYQTTIPQAESYVIRFVSTANEDCQLPPSLSALQLPPQARKEICMLNPHEQTKISNTVTNTTSAGHFALPVTAYFGSMKEIINYATQNKAFMDSLVQRNELNPFRDVVDKPTPQNVVAFMTKIQPTTCITFIKMFYPQQEGLKPIFKYVEKGDSDQIINRISQDKQLVNAIKSVYKAMT